MSQLSTFIGASCAPLQPPSFGNVNLSDGTWFDSVATYTCMYGYQLLGVVIRTCEGVLANGGVEFQWSAAVPTCQCNHRHIY